VATAQPVAGTRATPLTKEEHSHGSLFENIGGGQPQLAGRVGECYKKTMRLIQFRLRQK